ncbi:MAG: hypothetical protein HYX26_08860 [Acidobacteriales bacterium]|nr:hypothetical protein [Terriglobales bacterium]
MRWLSAPILFLSIAAFAQDEMQDAKPADPPPPAKSEVQPAPEAPPNKAVIPAGTKVLLVMKNSVSSKNARPGDGVYLESTFPVVENGRVVIPAGTFVQGVVDEVRRSGRVKGRAELLMHFTTLIYPNGYTLSLPGSLNAANGVENAQVKDDEGKLEAESTKGRDAATVATAAGTGGLIGGLSRGGKGAAIGGGIGAAVGILTTVFTRGEEVRLEPGTSVEMVLNRPVTVEVDRIGGNYQPANYQPTPAKRRSDRPALTVPRTAPNGPIVR